MSRKTRIRLPDGIERDALEMDFTIKNNEWNEYALSDGTTVRLRTLAVRIFRVLDDDGEPSFTAEGEPELFVWQNTTVMGPSNVQVALIETVDEKAEGNRGGTFTSSPLSGSTKSRPVSALPTRVIPRPSYGGGPEVSERPIGKVRNPFVTWAIASLRIMWSSLRHPGHPVWIDYRTGDVWLKRD